MPKSNRKKYASAFGAALSEQLERRQVSQRDLAAKTSVTPSYVNHTMAGRKTVSPQWADMIADVLGLPKAERAKLHYAAATDAGYRLPDLTKE